MRKILKRTLIVLGVIFIGIQLYPVDRTNPPIDPEMTFQAKVNVPPHIDKLVRNSCYDCHSHETTWPWYSYVAPVSWLVASDVEEGRTILNFSNWDYSMFRSVGRLDQMAEEVYQDRMPLPNYLIVHPSAKLLAADKDSLLDWIEVVREEIMNPPEESDTTAQD
ncbi:MAG: heme-binding domain-containing protein [Ignavibacteriae bacterium]|nr:heme-binding domain-containing protein [Ignavibacteriota bacterium]